MIKLFYNQSNLSLFQNELDLTETQIKEFTKVYVDTQSDIVKLLNDIGIGSIRKFTHYRKDIEFIEASGEYLITVVDGISKKEINASGSLLIDALNKLVKNIHFARFDYYEPFITKRASLLNLINR